MGAPLSLITGAEAVALGSSAEAGPLGSRSPAPPGKGSRQSSRISRVRTLKRTAMRHLVGDR